MVHNGEHVFGVNLDGAFVVWRLAHTESPKIRGYNAVLARQSGTVVGK